MQTGQATQKADQEYEGKSCAECGLPIEEPDDFCRRCADILRAMREQTRAA
jgi:hypothetical protein